MTISEKLLQLKDDIDNVYNKGYGDGGEAAIDNLPKLTTKTWTPATTDQTIASGTYLTGAQTIKGDSNLTAPNIKSGVTIFGVEGTASIGIDTSDATAAAEYICEGVTAYVNGQKITGTAEDDLLDFDLGGLDSSGSTGEIDFYPALDPNKTYWFSGKTVPCIKVPLDVFGDVTAADVRKDKIFTSSLGYRATGTMPDVTHTQPSISINAANGEVTASHTTTAGYTAAGTTSNILQLSVQGATTIMPSTQEQTAVAAGLYTKGAVKVAGDADLKAANIRNGVSIFNVTGTYTSDATADATHILKDKIAYSKGSKITGTMTNNGAWSCTGINAGSEYTIPAGYHNGSGKITTNSLSAQTQATATAENILADKTAWVNGNKITGTMPTINSIIKQASAEWDEGGQITYTTTSTDTGYFDGSTPIILGVEAYAFGNATRDDVVGGKTFTSTDGLKVAGTLKKQSSITAGNGGYPTSLPLIQIEGEQGETWIQINDTIKVGQSGYYKSVTNDLPTIAIVADCSAFGNTIASHVLAGETFTSAAGLKVTGTMIDKSNQFIAPSNIISSTHGDIDIYADVPATGWAFLPNQQLKIYIPGDDIGSATPSDVRAGKTFTSTSGLNITGTAEFDSDTSDYTLYGAYLMSDQNILGESYSVTFDLSQYNSIKSYFYDGNYWLFEDLDSIDIQGDVISVYSMSGNENFCSEGSWEDAWNSMQINNPRLRYIYIPNKITVDQDFYDVFTRITEPQENLFEIAYELAQDENPGTNSLPIAEENYF